MNQISLGIFIYKPESTQLSKFRINNNYLLKQMFTRANHSATNLNLSSPHNPRHYMLSDVRVRWLSLVPVFKLTSPLFFIFLEGGYRHPGKELICWHEIDLILSF